MIEMGTSAKSERVSLTDPLGTKRYTPSCIFRDLGYWFDYSQGESIYTMVVGLVAKSCPTLATPWTVACRVPLSVGFCRQEYCVGCRFLLQNSATGDLE